MKRFAVLNISNWQFRSYFCIFDLERFEMCIFLNTENKVPIWSINHTVPSRTRFSITDDSGIKAITKTIAIHNKQKNKGFANAYMILNVIFNGIIMIHKIHWVSAKNIHYNIHRQKPTGLHTQFLGVFVLFDL